MSLHPVETHQTVVCVAIRDRRVLEFVYRGKPRVVEPYCHGLTTTGLECVRAVQVGGGGSGFGFGKLWALGKMTNLRLAERTFVPDDPDYNPHDSAFAGIHCRVAAVQRLAAAGGRSRA